MKSRLSSALSLKQLIRLAGEVQAVTKGLGANDVLEIDVSEILPLDTAFLVTAANLDRFARAHGNAGVLYALSPDAKFTFEHVLTGLREAGEGQEGEFSRIERFELTNFASANPAIVQDIVGRFSDSIHNVPAKYERFEQCFAELMENVYVHSKCSWGGFLTGYLNKTEKRLQFSIADFGIGIPWTLGEVAPYDAGFDDDTLVYEASKYSITSKPGRAGSGLDYAAGFVKDLSGVMRLYSRRGCLRVDSESTCILEAEEEYPGTIVTLELPAR